jgi:N-acetylglucosaminyldiphosphoundecaprenol N-acetyl-beta-D-mannosaminyltransferase
MTQHPRRADARPLHTESAVDILGVPVTPWDAPGLLDAMVATAAGTTDGHPPLTTVHYANIHVLNSAYRDAALRSQLVRASTVYCDGAGVRLGAALLGAHLPVRLPADDIIDALCAKAAEAGVSLFLVAGAAGVADRAARVLRDRHPRLRILGTHHGYLDPTSTDAVVTAINRAGADLVIVGMGTPTQEIWVAEHRARINAPVVWTVGALFDFVAGVQRRAPRWVGDVNLEWLWRLATDPRRLARRYLLGNPLFLWRVLRQRVAGPASPPANSLS